MSGFGIRKILHIFLVISLGGCSHSQAEQPPQIINSYIAGHEQQHHFSCKTFDGAFSLRSMPPTGAGRLEVQFVSANFNGRAVNVSPEIHDAFDFIIHTQLIAGECIEQTASVGVVISAATKLNNLPRIRLYIDLTQSGAKFYELVCETDADIAALPGTLARLCTIEK